METNAHTDSTNTDSPLASVTLRSYQNEAINLLRTGFRKHKRQILALATGAGKSVIFSEMVRRAYDKGNQVLIVTHRIELLTQTLEHITHHRIHPQLITAKTKDFKAAAPIIIAMIETLSRRLRKLPPGTYNPKLIVIDESHRNDFNKIIDAFPDALVIGATATPNGKKMYKYYTNIVNNIGIEELINLGFLSKARSFQMQDDFSDVPVKHGEFAEKELYTHFNKSKLYSGVIDKWKEKTPGQKTIAYAVNIEHAENMCKEFNASGIRSECITSKTPMHERNMKFQAFKNGLYPVVTNCGVLTMGIDCPDCEVIILNRATMSLSLFLQMCGRGSRPYPGKPYFTILDFGQNFDRHGLWQEEREWTLAPPKKKKKGISPVKTCPQCDALLPASTKICPFCKHVFIIKTEDLKNGVMVELKTNIPVLLKGKNISSLSIEELIMLQRVKSYQAPFIWRILRSRGGEALSQYAYRMHYKPFWIKKQLDRIHDCKYRDFVIK